MIMGPRLWREFLKPRLAPPYGTPEEVREETEKLLREIGRGGGYIFVPAHSVSGDVPHDNILAMLEVLREQAGAEEVIGKQI